MDVEFGSKLANIRIDLHEYYSKLYATWSNDDLEQAYKILGQLVDQRNSAGPSLANEEYFKFDHLTPVDTAAFVLEAGLDEVDWLAKVEKPEDIEFRLHYIAEQETALMVDEEKDTRKDRKIAALKGRFLVLLAALLRLGMFKTDPPAPPPPEPPRSDWF